MSMLLPDEIQEDLQDAAYRRAGVLGIPEAQSGQSTAANTANLGTELGLSRESAYRLIKKFRKNGTVLSLVDRKRGRRSEHRPLDDEREKIIRTRCSSGTATADAVDLKQPRSNSHNLLPRLAKTAPFLQLAATSQSHDDAINRGVLPCPSGQIGSSLIPLRQFG